MKRKYCKICKKLLNKRAEYFKTILCCDCYRKYLKKHFKGRKLNPNNYIEKEILFDLYFNKKLSINKIAEKLKIHYLVIYRQMKEYKFQLRNLKEAKKVNPLFGINHPCWKGGKPKCKDCGKQLTNYSRIRCDNCNTLWQAKENHPNWQGGKSFEDYPQEFNKILKESIRKRDNYICQNCGMTEEEHLIVYGEVLNIHHIDYNKQNCKKDNLITLCRQCNIRANKNRDHWQEIYTKIKLTNKKLII